MKCNVIMHFAICISIMTCAISNALIILYNNINTRLAISACVLQFLHMMSLMYVIFCKCTQIHKHSNTDMRTNDDKLRGIRYNIINNSYGAFIYNNGIFKWCDNMHLADLRKLIPQMYEANVFAYYLHLTSFILLFIISLVSVEIVWIMLIMQKMILTWAFSSIWTVSTVMLVYYIEEKNIIAAIDRETPCAIYKRRRATYAKMIDITV